MPEHYRKAFYWEGNMNQILLYSGFSVAVLMFLLCVVIWFRLHIWKTWKDVSSYRVQKLGKSHQTMPLPVSQMTAETGESKETTLLHSDKAEWSVLEEVIFIYTNGI